MSRAWCLMGNRGVSISKPEAVSPEDPPEAGCSPTIILLPMWMEIQIQALSWGSPRHVHTYKHTTTTAPKAHQALAPNIQLLQPAAVHPLISAFPPWPLIAFMPLFSQCEKFDNVHKRNSRIAAGYGKSTHGSSLQPLWRRLRICSFIDLF